jgi:hypothetical protein
MAEKLKRWKAENGEYEGYTYRGYFIVKDRNYRGEWNINAVDADGYWDYLRSLSSLASAKYFIDSREWARTGEEIRRQSRKESK